MDCIDLTEGDRDKGEPAGSLDSVRCVHKFTTEQTFGAEVGRFRSGPLCVVVRRVSFELDTAALLFLQAALSRVAALRIASNSGLSMTSFSKSSFAKSSST